MRQLPLAGSGHPKTSAILTEFTSASINNHCLDSRWQDWLHCLTRLTNCHQHSHVSSTHARAHALWCAVRRDSLTHHNITYLACDGPRFRVIILTFDLMTFNSGNESAVTWPKMYQILDKKKQKDLQQNFQEAFLMLGLAQNHSGSLQPSPRPPGWI